MEGRVAIQYVETNNPKDNFTFKCHRSTELSNGYQEIYAVILKNSNFWYFGKIAR